MIRLKKLIKEQQDVTGKIDHVGTCIQAVIDYGKSGKSAPKVVFKGNGEGYPNHPESSWWTDGKEFHQDDHEWNTAAAEARFDQWDSAAEATVEAEIDDYIIHFQVSGYASGGTDHGFVDAEVRTEVETVVFIKKKNGKTYTGKTINKILDKINYMKEFYDILEGWIDN